MPGHYVKKIVVFLRSFAGFSNYVKYYVIYYVKYYVNTTYFTDSIYEVFDVQSLGVKQ